MSEELDRLAVVFRRFAEDEARRTSPLYERLALAAVDDPQVRALLLSAPPPQRKATLFFAGIHHLLLHGARGELASFFPDIAEQPSGTDPSNALREFCSEHADELRALYARRNTQTNEVARTTYLLPMVGVAAEDARAPIALIELGASAGLNLLFDRYFFDYGDAGSVGDPASTLHLATDVRGARPSIPASMPNITWRAGIDLQPVDVNDDDAVAWLRACIWPEHAARVERFERAVAIARAHPPRIVEGEAVATVGSLIEETPEGMPVCVMHTAMTAYLDRDAQLGLRAAIHDAAKARTLYWVAAEGPRSLSAVFPDVGVHPVEGGYGLVVSKVGSTERWAGKAGYHGAWLEWSDPPISVS